MTPQDIYAFQGVALRTGCSQLSDYRLEDVTFNGTLVSGRFPKRNSNK